MQTYFAKSILSSKTFWVNLALLLVYLAEDTTIVKTLPAVVTQNLVAIAAVLNVILRFFAVRPVAAIMPNETKPIAVKSI